MGGRSTRKDGLRATVEWRSPTWPLQRTVVAFRVGDLPLLRWLLMHVDIVRVVRNGLLWLLVDIDCLLVQAVARRRALVRCLLKVLIDHGFDLRGKVLLWMRRRLLGRGEISESIVSFQMTNGFDDGLKISSRDGVVVVVVRIDALSSTIDACRHRCVTNTGALPQLASFDDDDSVVVRFVERIGLVTTLTRLTLLDDHVGSI